MFAGQQCLKLISQILKPAGKIPVCGKQKAGLRMKGGISVMLLTTAMLWLVPLPGSAQPEDPPFLRHKTSSFPLTRPDADAATPFTVLRTHDVNNLLFTITNWGTIGGMGGDLVDPMTGLSAPGAYFPASTNFEHLYLGALWVGGLIGSDTVVSTAHDMYYGLTEFYPGEYFSGGRVIERSIRSNSAFYSPEAVSEQDFIAEYADTLTAQAYVPADQWSWRPHKPLNLRVRQESFAWPYQYAEDFIIIRYWIANMGESTIREAWVGFQVQPQVHHLNLTESMWDDQIGYRDTMASIAGYGFSDTLQMVWFADNDGDPAGRSGFDGQSIRSAAGFSIIGEPQWVYHSDWGYWDDYHCWRWRAGRSFNWWVSSSNAAYDWGPQHEPRKGSWIGGMGEPLGDRHKYRRMSNGEIDYDQVWANTDFSSQGWITPPYSADEYFANNISRGYATRGLLSAGPYDIEAGDSIEIVLAFACGDGFHLSADNIRNLPRRQTEYLKNLDFTDLSRNMQWARWVYDNPGIDTDEDGCRGYFLTSRCRDTTLYWDGWYPYDAEICDTVFYSGDGVPDLKGPPPPPSPELIITSEPGKIHLEWDGRLSETFYDGFSRRPDFEGYNVYLGLGHNPNSLALMSSWDRVNFEPYHYDRYAFPSPWVSSERPMTLDELAAVYGADFDPRNYPDPVSCYYADDGTRYYFKPHGGNRGNAYEEGGRILTNPIQYIRTDSLWSGQTQSYLYFGHYQCTIDDLLPSQSYYFAVTAFDHGFPEGGLSPLESSPQTNMQLAYASYSPNYVQEKKLRVSVYPNPYRIDGKYREMGYEDPNHVGFKERTRRIHFVNLPERATIKIFSLDGDLIREIHHPDDRFSDTPSHTAWDMITRNTQAVVSGIYLYTVESDQGTQVGKIVIIK
jgi:hypothetical protein